MSHLLIVDDQQELALLLQAILQRAGHACSVAHDVADAWALLGPTVDLVLLDVSMPGENGPELVRRMQLDPTLADIPVVFVSGRDDPATRIQCLAMGARAFLAKPVDRRVLLETVREVLSKQAPGDGDPLASVLDDEGVAAVDAAGRGAAAGAELLGRLRVERQVLRRQLASYARLVSALARLQQLMGGGYPLERVAQGVGQLALGVLGGDRAVVWFPAGEQLRPLAAVGGAAPAPVALDGVAGPAAAWRGGRPGEEASDEPHVHLLHVPLTVAAAPVGVLSVRVRDSERPSASLSAFFCAEAALALDAALRFTHTQSEALTDPLTGLPNRRHLDRRLDEEVRRALALGVPLGVLFVDIDRFKAVNDRCGHERGDAVLRTVATAMRETLRAVDVVARYGGEEFVVLLPDADRAAARAVAGRLHAAVAARGPSVLPERPLSVTIGVASLPEDGRDGEYLLACADAAMLRGKRGGRDRVEPFAGAVPAAAAALPTRAAAAVIRACLRALALKDRATERHSVAVGALSVRVARRLGVDATTLRDVAHVGLLHDVGKLYTPDAVLLKPGPLDAAEREIMERHVTLGAALLAATPELRHLTRAVAASQEHFDGSGYPDGIAGAAIPLPARIVAVTDAFHAMTSDRPYRAAMPLAAAAAELRRCAGTQFDPGVVAALLAVLGVGADAAVSVATASADAPPPPR